MAEGTTKEELGQVICMANAWMIAAEAMGLSPTLTAGTAAYVLASFLAANGRSSDEAKAMVDSGIDLYRSMVRRSADA